MVRSAFFALLLASVLPAQASTLTGLRHPLNVDSTWLDNDSGAERVVWKHEVKVAQSMWLRVFFDQANLPTGSYLRIESLADKDFQTLDATSLREYGNASCYFNGESVRVELIAAPRTKANRVKLVAATAGFPVAETVCGPNDDRKQSFDRRQGRLNGGCTAWLFGDDALGSAGHCGNTWSVMLVEFNVPNSTAAGRIVRSRAADQYPTVVGSAKLLDKGVGADWMVARMGRNSQTRKLPGAVQGFYRLGKPPTTTSNQVIRITGYGTSGIATLNQVQKTHTGPLAGISSTALEYRTDTTGGNSGSPILHENSGLVVGVHSHGGCNGSHGANKGTRIDRPDFDAAIRGLIGQAGGVTHYGKACGTKSGTPALTVSGTPKLGGLLSVQIRGLPRGVVGLQLVGLHQRSIDLSFLGFAGCTQLVSMDWMFGVGTDSLGNAVLLATIPHDTGSVGKSLHLQFAANDPTSKSLAASNAARVTVGF